MRRRGLLAAGACWGLLRESHGEGAFPARPITLVVPFAPGGIADLTARTVSAVMARTLGQAIIVDNRPSAGSVVGSNAVAHSAADGYTLLLLSNANAVSTGLFRKLPFDVVRDFAPITTLAFFDLGVFVPEGSRFLSLKELVAYAKDRPGTLTAGTISVGSTQHLAAELFKTHAGIDMLIVPYKGTPAVQTALRAGEIDVAFEILGPMLAQAVAKVVRVLAVTSNRRYAAMPEVPTVIEAGVPGYVVASWNALAAPTRTAPVVIERLHRAAVDAVAQPAVQQRLLEFGARAESGSPKQLESLLASEIKRWGEVIRVAKIEPE